MSHAYVQVKPCGCVVAAIIDDSRWADEIGDFYRQAAARGFAVERMETDAARESLRTCDCPKPAENPDQQALEVTA